MIRISIDYCVKNNVIIFKVHVRTQSEPVKTS